MTNLMQASHNWATRSADQRYASLQDMFDTAWNRRRMAATSTVLPRDLMVVESQDDGICLMGPTGAQAAFTNWSFSQVCSFAKMDQRTMTRLSSELAAKCVTYGLKNIRDEKPNSLLLDVKEDQSITVRAITGTGYSRIWDFEVLDRLMALEGKGWKVPPAFGNLPSGLYMSDRDYFVFMVNENNRIDDGSDEGLARGFFMWGSEVGKASQGAMAFLYRYVCGNHIVWDAEVLAKIRIRHTGLASKRFWVEFNNQVNSWVESSASNTEELIQKAKMKELGKKEEDIVDLLFSKKLLTKGQAKEVVRIAEDFSHIDGNPRSAWGVAQAITRMSQTSPHADARTAKDKTGMKVLRMAL